MKAYKIPIIHSEFIHYSDIILVRAENEIEARKKALDNHKDNKEIDTYSDYCEITKEEALKYASGEIQARYIDGEIEEVEDPEIINAKKIKLRQKITELQTQLRSL